MDKMLQDLTRLFTKQTGFTDDVDELLVNQLEDTIEYLSKLEWEHFQTFHSQLSGLLHDQGSQGLPFLTYILEKRFQTHSRLKTIDKPKPTRTNLSLDEFTELSCRCIEFQPKEGLRILTYQMPDITPWSERAVLPWLRAALNECALVPLDAQNLTSDLAVIGNYLGMSRCLTRSLNEPEETYLQFELILQRISRDGYQQLARDYSEEVMACAIADDIPEYGHYCRLNLANSQRNPIDAALHACLLAIRLQSVESITNDFHIQILIGIFTFYRTTGMFERADLLHDEIQAFPGLTELNRQHITMAYFNMLLMMGNSDLLTRADSYVTRYYEAISIAGEVALVPWLALICNLKTLYPGKFEVQAALKKLESHIEKNLPTAQLESIKVQILAHQPNAKEHLRESLDKLTRSRNTNDHVYEVNLLQARASRVIETSLETGDIEGILLGHQASSDGSLAFNLAPRLARHALIRHDAETSHGGIGRFKDYLSQIQKKLLNHPNYRYVWLGFESERVYYLIHEEDRFLSYGYIPGCTQSSVTDWLANVLPDLGFNDSPPGQGPFRIREDIWSEESDRIQASVPKFHLPESSKCTIVFSDVEMSCFPHNLLIDLVNNIQPQALCSPLSLDHYLRCAPSQIDVSKVNVWAPLNQKDGAIELAYSRLKQHMDNHPASYEEGLLPSFESEADVKLFICHGGRDRDGGFTGLYPSDKKKYTTPGILGTGKVAVLFVCHGGHIASDIYARSFQTLAKTLLLAGYETVIAPAWSLNVTIPGPWTEVFLQQLKEGQDIVNAAAEANHRIKEIYPVESAWAAMHVFGNPHLRGAEPQALRM